MEKIDLDEIEASLGYLEDWKNVLNELRLARKVIDSISDVMEHMEKHEVDMYWFGQLTAHLDSHNIDVYELMHNKTLKIFDDERNGIDEARGDD